MDVLSFRDLHLTFRLPCKWPSSCSKDSSPFVGGYSGSPNQSKLRWASACKNGSKRSRKELKIGKSNDNLLQNDQADGSLARVVESENSDEIFSSDYVEETKDSVSVPSRRFVLQACTVTSGFIGLLGFLLRQISHVAPSQGWSVFACSEDITFGFEPSHLGLVAGSVILVTSSRLLLLNTWPDFAE